MKKRILALTLVLCMVLPILPLSALAKTVDGLYYDSPYARDVVFGDVPSYAWYTGKGGDLYAQNAATVFTDAIPYATYMAEFDRMVGFNDIIIEAGMVESNGYDADEKGWYNDIPADVCEQMNISTANGYITREVVGKAHKSIDTLFDASRPAQYIYAYYFDPTEEEGYTGPDELPKMVINTGSQNEFGSIYGIYYLINDILHNYEGDPVLEYLRHNVKLVIVPCLSPGAVNQDTYWNANFVNTIRNTTANFKEHMVGGYAMVDGVLTLTPGGLLNADGSNAAENPDGPESCYQNTGYVPFDQAEACIIRDLLKKNWDAFYYTDFHTNGSGNLPEGKWIELNWQCIGVQPDNYAKKLENAAKFEIKRVSANFHKEFNLGAYGVTEGALLSHMTTDSFSNFSGYAEAELGILSSLLEGFSGWPGGTVETERLGPLCAKANSENIGNWLIAILGEYAYDGDHPSATYTTSFVPYGENWPTFDFPKTESGRYDVSAYPTTGNYTCIDPTVYPITYHGNWQVGTKDIANSQTTSTVAPFTSDPANFKPYDSVWNYWGDLFLAMEATAYDNNMYFFDGGMTFNAANGSAQLISGWSGNGWGGDATVRYTAEYDGKVVIGLNNLTFHTDTSQVVVMKNGEVIGSVKANAGNSNNRYNGNGGFYAGNPYAPTTQTFETTVKAGDTIDFVSHTNPEVVEIASGRHDGMRRGVTGYTFSVSYYEDNTTQDISAHHSGKTDAVKNALLYGTEILPFLIWKDADGNQITSQGTTLVGAKAGINPALISGGYIASDATWSQAIDAYLVYMQNSLPELAYTSGWVPGALEAEGNPCAIGEKFVPITNLSLFEGSNIMAVSNGTGTFKPGYSNWPGHTGNQFVVSEEFYKRELTNYSSFAYALNYAGTASSIVIDYNTQIADKYKTFSAVNPPNSYGFGALPTAYAMYATSIGDYRGTALQAHTPGGGFGFRYTVPAGVKNAKATLQFAGAHMRESNVSSNLGFLFAIYMNGTPLVAYTATCANTVVADVQHAIEKIGELTVNTGDAIEFRFKMYDDGGYNFLRIAPAIGIDIEHGVLVDSVFNGADPAVETEPPYGADVLPFVIWRNTETKAQITSGSLTGCEAVINPALISGGYVSANATWTEAIDQYLIYMQEDLTELSFAGGWSLGALESNDGTGLHGGTTYVPIVNRGLFNCGNIMAVSTSGNYKPGYTASSENQFLISENYYKKILEVYASSAYSLSVSGTAENIVVPFSDISAKCSSFAIVQPVNWGNTFGNAAAYVRIDAGTVPYVLRAHEKGSGFGFSYTVPAGVANGLLHMEFSNPNASSANGNVALNYMIYINGDPIATDWIVSSVNLIETHMSAELAKLEGMTVNAGDTIQICIKEVGHDTLKMYPTLYAKITTPEEPPVALHRVQYTSGGNVVGSVLAKEGISIAELLATFKATNPNYASSGLYVDGIWYDAGATLPAVGGLDVVIDDVKMDSSASITVGSTYDIKVYLPAIDGMTAAGVMVHGKKVPAIATGNGDYTVTVATVYAKNLLDTTVTYTPYYDMADGSTLTGSMVTVRAKDLLNTYITGDYDAKVKNLAAAALDYAATAKAYFGAKELDADLVAKLAGYDTAIAADTAPMTNIAEAGATYEFYAATLQIDETVSFVLAIRGNGVWDLDPNSILNLNGHAVTPTTYATSWIGNEKVLILSVGNVPEAEFANHQVFTLTVDGGLQSTLTYSVNAYCNRNLTKAADAEANMIRAIYAIGQAAKAYNA